MVDGNQELVLQENPLFKMERDKVSLHFIEHGFVAEGSITKETPDGILLTPQEIAKLFPKWIQDRVTSISEAGYNPSSKFSIHILNSMTLKDVAEFAERHLIKQQELARQSSTQYDKSVEIWKERKLFAQSAVRVVETMRQFSK